MADELAFSGSERCCVLVVDMVESTMTTFQIATSEKVRSLYKIFINRVEGVATRHGAEMMKRTGDGVIFYFPKTLGSEDRLSFKEVLECGLAMIRARCEINAELEEKGLPAISYRICADHGKHEVVRDRASKIEDLFGPTMNMCGKMKSHPNAFVIGGDFYENVKSFSEFSFKYVGECKIDPKRGYPIYSVLHNGNVTMPATITPALPVSLRSYDSLVRKHILGTQMSPDNIILKEPAKIDD